MDKPPTPQKPQRRRRPKKVPAPIAGRLEDPRQDELFADLPHLKEPVPDWAAHWPAQEAG